MRDHSSFLDQVLDGTLGFDPLEAFDDEPSTDEPSEGYLGTPHDDEPAPEPDTRPAEERIADLFASLAPCRKTLLGMIAFCAVPRASDALDAEVNRLQTDNFSVYSPASLTQLLERAGALVRVTDAGEPYPEEDPEPRLVEIDGASYYEVAEAPLLCWLATPEGAAWVAADNPHDRLAALFEADARYLPIYERLLALCAEAGGATTPALNEAVDGDELLENPRLYAPHFIDKLEKCDAIEWKKSWQITEVGRQGQQLLADLASDR